MFLNACLCIAQICVIDGLINVNGLLQPHFLQACCKSIELIEADGASDKTQHILIHTSFDIAHNGGNSGIILFT